MRIVQKASYNHSPKGEGIYPLASIPQWLEVAKRDITPLYFGVLLPVGWAGSQGVRGGPGAEHRRMRPRTGGGMLSEQHLGSHRATVHCSRGWYQRWPRGCAVGHQMCLFPHSYSAQPLLQLGCDHVILESVWKISDKPRTIFCFFFGCTA